MHLSTLPPTAPPVAAPDPAVPSFTRTLADHGLPRLRRGAVTTLQVNVGRLCNLACHHCHVEAGPSRTEVMDGTVAQRIVEVLERNPSLDTLDLTGGAPELNPHFRRLATEARRMGRQVIDRCNLTVLFEPGQDGLAEFLAAHGVTVVASLPCWLQEDVDRQRGRGTYDASIEALRRLNALGYGRPGSPLGLDLVYNPLGANLPPAQAALEQQYREEMARRFGIEFRRLLTITNMPIRRFAAMLAREQRHAAYMSLLVNHFNPATVPGLMCRSLVSVGWDGRLYDCDFNQMLDLPLGAGTRTGTWRIADLGAVDVLVGKPVAVGGHCHGCTAGAGSSCSGSLA